MPFELKTEFDPAEDVITYLKGNVLTELQRLQTVESEAEAEKAWIIANRDELRSEKKTLQDKLTTTEAALTQAQADLAEVKKGATDATDLEAKFVQVREQLEADYTQKIEAIQSEREAEKQQAAAARLKANAMAELSKPEYRSSITLGRGKLRPLLQSSSWDSPFEKIHNRDQGRKSWG